MPLSSGGSLLLLSGATGFSPLSLPGFRWHFAIDDLELVYDGAQSRDEVNTLYEQGGSGADAVAVTYPGDGLTGQILRPPYIADAGDGEPAIDGSDAMIGRGLAAPIAAADLDFLHDGASPWTLSTGLILGPSETKHNLLVSTGGLTAADPGISLWARKISSGYTLDLEYSDGSTAEHCLRTVISPPDISHLWLVCDPSSSWPIRLWRNGVELDYWQGTLPTGAGHGLGLGLVMGNFARASAYTESCWRGRWVTILDEPVTNESKIRDHVEYAHSKGWV